ncbi:MAG: succinate dehydrogenase iron-sulfur subunit [Phycisphaerae bacterium]
MIASKTKTFRVRIQRQDSPTSRSYMQEFEVEHEPNMNITATLQKIAANPVTTDGKKTTAPVWEAQCLEEVCGSCSFVINGRARQGCTALIDHLLKEQSYIELRPMDKFPVLRDLIVDRSRMFAALKKVKAWIPVDTYADIGDGPPVSPQTQDIRYPISQCMTCGVCLQVCPQVNDRSDFIGPQAIAQAVLFNEHPTGKITAGERLDALMEPGGIADCGNAQNCVKACPKGVPLTWAIGKIGRDTTIHAMKKWFVSLKK